MNSGFFKKVFFTFLTDKKFFYIFFNGFMLSTLCWVSINRSLRCGDHKAHTIILFLTAISDGFVDGKRRDGQTRHSSEDYNSSICPTGIFNLPCFGEHLLEEQTIEL